MTWDWDYALQCLPQLLAGLWVTVKATLLASVIASVLGLVWAILRLMRIPALSFLVRVLTDFLRGTPLLVQLFFLFYVFPYYGIRLSAFMTGVIGLGAYAGAYMSEVYRAGIENLPRGQLEVSATLGLPPLWTWLDIIVPQAVRTVFPALGNYVVVMFKYTPLLSAITVTEMLSEASQIGSQSYRFFVPMTLVGVLFLAVSIPAAYALRAVETRIGRTL